MRVNSTFKPHLLTGLSFFAWRWSAPCKRGHESLERLVRYFPTVILHMYMLKRKIYELQVS